MNSEELKRLADLSKLINVAFVAFAVSGVCAVVLSFLGNWIGAYVAALFGCIAYCCCTK